MVRFGAGAGAVVEQGSSSFLKKRTKKLLFFQGIAA
jgi:hypothetical protein